MSAFTNDGAFWWMDGQEASQYYTSASRQYHAPVIGNQSDGELHWVVEPRREVSLPPGLAFTSSCLSPSLPQIPFACSAYGGAAWPSNQLLDEAYFDALFSMPDGNVDAPETSFLTGMEVETPVQQAFPVAQSALPASRPCPSLPLNCAQASQPSSQPFPVKYPVRTTTHQAGHSTSVGSLGMGPEIPRSQVAAPSVIPEQIIPTGHPPSMTAPHSVPRLTRNDPVPAAPFIPRPRGQRWDLAMITATFPCLWSSGSTRCMADIAGDRSSITSHLREEHDFTCDSQVIACAWGACTAAMQRRNIPRHILACHFEVKVPCEGCGMLLSRADASKKHRVACTRGAGGTSVRGGEQDDGRLFF